MTAQHSTVVTHPLTPPPTLVPLVSSVMVTDPLAEVMSGRSPSSVSNCSRNPPVCEGEQAVVMASVSGEREGGMEGGTEESMIVCV